MLVDQNGQPFRQSELATPQTSSSAQLVQLHRDLASHPARGLTPARLNTILEEAEQGSLIAQHDLFRDIEERDGHVFAELSKRKRAVIKLNWDIVPPRNATRAEEDLAAYVKELIQDMSDFEDMQFDALDGIGHGFAALELQWQRIGSDWTVQCATHRPQSWFQLDPDTRNELRLRDHSAGGAQLQPFGWLLHIHRAMSGYTARAGLARVLVWPYLFKHFSVGDLAEFLDIYGLPLRIGKFPSQATDAEKATLWRAVAGIGHNAAGIIPASMAIEFQEAAKGSEKPFQAMIEWCEKTQSKAITGSTLGMDTGRGGIGEGLSNIQNEIRLDIRDSDCKQLAGTLTRSLIYPLLAINKGWSDIRRCPRFVYDTLEAEDLKTYSDSLPKLVAIGMQIPAQWAHEKLRIPQPTANETVLATQSAAPATPPTDKPKPPAKAALAALAALSETKSDGKTAFDDDAPLPGPQPDLSGMMAIDATAQNLPPEQLDAHMQAVLTPIMQAVLGASSLEDVQAALDAIAEHIDTGPLAQALGRAGFGARWMGRGDE